jgi:hypothetical protein
LQKRREVRVGIDPSLLKPELRPLDAVLDEAAEDSHLLLMRAAKEV